MLRSIALIRVASHIELAGFSIDRDALRENRRRNHPPFDLMHVYYFSASARRPKLATFEIGTSPRTPNCSRVRLMTVSKALSERTLRGGINCPTFVD